jgi:hypothetical protein
MFESDKRILHLIDLLVFKKVIPNPSAFCDQVKLQRQNLSKIRNGEAHFTPQHIERACKTYNVNANWVFGIQDTVFNTPGSIEITEIPSPVKSSTRSSTQNKKAQKKA